MVEWMEQIEGPRCTEAAAAAAAAAASSVEDTDAAAAAAANTMRVWSRWVAVAAA